MERKIVVYLPYLRKGVQKNEFVDNMIKILRQKYVVQGRLCSIKNVISMEKTKAVILNWVEYNLTDEQKEQILTYQEHGTKIIWFFHNKTAHESELADQTNRNMVWLADHSDKIVLLSRSSSQYVPGYGCGNEGKIRYIPHIKYENRYDSFVADILKERYQIKDKYFVMCIFGMIRPYKNIELAINTFKRVSCENVRLVIAGCALNKEYEETIQKIIQEDTRIFADFRFLSDVELDCLIGLSDVVLMSYSDRSSINSGVLIKAMSNGRAVVAPEICMVKDISEDEKFIYRWNQENEFSKKMLQVINDGKAVVRQKGSAAKEYIDKNNNEAIVSRELFQIIEEADINEKIENVSVQWDNSVIAINDLEAAVNRNEESFYKYHYLFQTMCCWMRIRNRKLKIEKWLSEKNVSSIAIYGYGEIGKLLHEELDESHIEVRYMIDKNAEILESNVPVILPDDNYPDIDMIIVTAISSFDEIRDSIKDKTDAIIVSFDQIIEQLQIRLDK